MTMDISAQGAGQGRSLLLVDDDEPFRTRLGRALEKRGFVVFLAESVQRGLELGRANKPQCAVIDLRLADGSGLDIVPALREMRADCRIVMLTAYGNIATAVAASRRAPSITWRNRPTPTPSSMRCCPRPQPHRRCRPIRCRPTESGGSISCACSSNAAATSRRRRVG